MNGKDIKAGIEIASIAKTAYQRALEEKEFLSDSIHHEEYTKSRGYSGALVSGYVLCAYFSEMLVGFFGPNWLCGGKLSLSFIGRGIQKGDRITCRGVVTEKIEEQSGTRVNLNVWMEKNDGAKVVVGKASGVFL